MKNTPENFVALEISIKTGDFNIWTLARVKGAFNNGNGAIKHLKDYANDNRSYCRLIFSESAALEYINKFNKKEVTTA